MEEIDRRDLLRRAGLGAAGLGAAGLGAFGATEAVTATRGSASAHDGPNIVLIIIDSLRPDHLGAFAGKRAQAKTPNIDALARDSLRFTNVFPTSMPTVPARRAILSGREIFPFFDWHSVKGLANGPGWLPITGPTFLHGFRDAGYWTGYVTDNPFLAWARVFKHFRHATGNFYPLGGQVGLRGRLHSVSLKETKRWLPRALRDEDEHLLGMRRYLVNTGNGRHERETCAARTFGKAAEVLEQASKRHRPFALVVDSFDPHEPWAPPRKYLKRAGIDPDGQISAIPRYTTAGYLSRHELRSMRAAYAGEVMLVDRWLGHFMDRLHDLGRDEDTAVALISDHGIFLGEHNLTGKIAKRLFDELIHVPMLLRDPGGRRHGEASTYPASTPDIAPTLFAMAGLQPPRSLHVQGTSVSPLLDGERARSALPARELLFGGYSDHFYARKGRWALSADNRGHDRVLNDLRHDPTRHHNIAGSHRRVARRLHHEVIEATGGRKLPYY